ncbi:MAG TPA: tail fiber domain-containing protein [Pyrinomonadaceae bacterium]|nr:tail fiber domain-containing protein [Pyrinomonadaceae bacterium]
MQNRKYVTPMLGIVFVIACLSVSAMGQANDQFASLNGSGSGVRWDIRASHAASTLTVISPEGEVFVKEFQSGQSPEFQLSDKRVDGQYIYELRLTPNFAAGVKEQLKAAREKGKSEEVQRELKRRGALPEPLVQSGGFSVVNGIVVVGGTEEPGPGRRNAKVERPSVPASVPAAVSSARPSGRVNYKINRHHPRFMFFDQVIPDDLIVQGSICAGLDCVNNENFGFDTIRMKENNTRLQFDDTSTTAGFPTNNWQIRANDSAGGGTSHLAFVDQGATGNSETGTIVFAVDAGARANALRVNSSSNVGLGTATAALDFHVNTTDTPAIRLEQNNTGGFTAQTWDIGANEANFFIRDVTGGSRLSLRIRPGAPTSSIDIAANGNVGIANGSPSTTLDVSGNTLTLGSDSGATTRTNATTKLNRIALPAFTTGNLSFGVLNAATTSTENLVAIGGGASGFSAATSVLFSTAGNNNTDTGTERMRITSIGRVGIGTTSPDQLLSVNGDASKVGGGSWQSFSDRRLKNVKSPFTTGLSAVMKLQPVRYEYKSNNVLGLPNEGEHVGFAAQEVQKVIPEAVTSNSSGYLMVNNDPILWTMLNAIKEQQKEITELKRQVRQLRANQRRRK